MASPEVARPRYTCTLSKSVSSAARVRWCSFLKSHSLQLVRRFRARLGDSIAVLHSGLGDGARFDQWRRLRRGELSVAIGARSGVFAPVKNLGLIIVDEEHDPSFKQGDGVRYQGRDMALMRGFRAGATVVLGSATPRWKASTT